MSVTFSHKGITSLVSILETPKEKLILKIPLGLGFSSGEGQFLKAWERAGVHVPHVIEEGILENHPYVLMSYVDAETLPEVSSSEELIEKETFIDLGRILHAMHEPKTAGYGRVIDGKAEFNSFENWLASDDMQRRFQYVQENKILGEEHGSLPHALQALVAHVSKENTSSYCHDDFGPHNIFATDPLTVFDPNPRFNNGYVDLGRSIAKAIADSGDGRAGMQLIKGYFGEEPFDEKALHAAVLLSMYMKMPYWHKVKRNTMMRNIREYLIQNKHLLED